MELFVLLSIVCGLLINIGPVTPSELRFCYKGWQRLKKDDCPYGLVFKYPVDLECYFSFGPDSPKVYDDVCTEPFTIKQKPTPTDDLPLVHNMAKIVLIDFLNDTVMEKEVKDWVDLRSCYVECSNSEEDPQPDSHEGDDSVEILEQEDALNVISDETKKKLTDQTLRLGDHLFDKIYTLNLHEFEDTSNRTEPEIRLVEMFKKTMLILSKTCKHPFLHKDYINRVYHGFLFLVRDMGTHTIEDVSVEEFEDIMEGLDLCEQRGQLFRLEGSVCASKATVKEIVKVSDEGQEITALVKTGRREAIFPLHKYDLFIESAWRAIDAVHGTCFGTFRPNSNMHHRYQRAMEMLFNEKMQERWINPTELDDVKDWGSWFLVDIQTTMENLQHCVRGAYEGAPFTVRLDRPIDHKRFKREIRENFYNYEKEMESENRDDATAVREERSVSAPFQDPFAEEWAKYERDGGITMKLSEDITCLATEWDRIRLLSKLRSSCGSS